MTDTSITIKGTQEGTFFVVKSVVGEENFVDMTPNKSNNYCCGGGGGFLQSGYKAQRLAYGRLKDEPIKATGADYCIAGCHNCHAQIHESASITAATTRLCIFGP